MATLAAAVFAAALTIAAAAAGESGEGFTAAGPGKMRLGSWGIGPKAGPAAVAVVLDVEVDIDVDVDAASCCCVCAAVLDWGKWWWWWRWSVGRPPGERGEDEWGERGEGEGEGDDAVPTRTRATPWLEEETLCVAVPAAPAPAAVGSVFFVFVVDWWRRFAWWEWS